MPGVDGAGISGVDRAGTPESGTPRLSAFSFPVCVPSPALAGLPSGIPRTQQLQWRNSHSSGSEVKPQELESWLHL